MYVYVPGCTRQAMYTYAFPSEARITNIVEKRLDMAEALARRLQPTAARAAPRHSAESGGISQRRSRAVKESQREGRP